MYPLVGIRNEHSKSIDGNNMAWICVLCEPQNHVGVNQHSHSPQPA
jgi:hypothetical protein